MMRVAEPSRVGGWAWQLGAWTLVGVVQFTDDLTRLHTWNGSAWIGLLVVHVLVSFTWALATPFVMRLGQRFPFERRNLVRRLAQHALFSLVITGAIVGALTSVFFLIGV